MCVCAETKQQHFGFQVEHFLCFSFLSVCESADKQTNSRSCWIIFTLYLNKIKNNHHLFSSERFKVSKGSIRKPEEWSHDTCSDVITSKWHLSVSAVLDFFPSTVSHNPSGGDHWESWGGHVTFYLPGVQRLMSHTNEEESCSSAAFMSFHQWMLGVTVFMWSLNGSRIRIRIRIPVQSGPDSSSADVPTPSCHIQPFSTGQFQHFDNLYLASHNLDQTEAELTQNQNLNPSQSGPQDEFRWGLQVFWEQVYLMSPTHHILILLFNQQKLCLDQIQDLRSDLQVLSITYTCTGEQVETVKLTEFRCIWRHTSILRLAAELQSAPLGSLSWRSWSSWRVSPGAWSSRGALRLGMQTWTPGQVVCNNSVLE